MRQVWVSTVLLPLLFLGGGVALRGQMPILGEAPTATLPGPPPSNRGPEPRAVTLPPTLLWYDITNRETVRATWNQTFAPTSGVPLGWTGDVASNNPGTTTQAYKDAVATRINWFRAMAGVPAGVVLDPTYSAKDQKAALMFSANRALSHFPPSNWIDYSADGAEAAGKSNICAGFGLTTDTGCVLGYIIDNGSNNAAVGHRSALLFPQTTTMGTGDVPQTGSNYWANALWVQDANIFSTRPSTREAYVAWPPPGFVPYQVVGARWSFAYYNADFSAASVTMTRNGATVPVRLEPVVQTGCPPSICFPENTLVWVPDNLGTSNYTPVAPANDTTSTVTINNVKINGVSQSFTYSVTVFDPGTSGTTPSPGSLVISQVYGGGGNSGSMLRNDFLELFNPGSQSVTLTGWSLQYASATGTVWVRTLLSGVVPPGQYYLVQEHAEGGGSAALPTPDLVGDISMSATDGKIALVSNSDLLSGAAPSGAQMVDFVGYGGANFAEGSPTAGLSNTTAAIRRLGGCSDTNNNQADFSIAAPSPRNSHSPANLCSPVLVQPPAPVSVSPVVSSGANQTITVTINAPGGYQSLGVVNVLINNALDGRAACYLAYVQSVNYLYIVPDNGDGTQLSGKAMDGTGVVGNSQCTISLAASSAVGSGNTLTLALNANFPPTFAGSKVIYAAARDSSQNNSGWQTMGVHVVPGAATTFPNPVGISPSSGNTLSTTLTFTYQDQSNANNFQTVWALINTAVDARAACYVAYYRPGNLVLLFPDSGDGSLVTSMVLAGNNTVSNGQCTVSAQGGSAQIIGNTLNVTLPITFKAAFSGFKGIWLAANTLAGQTSPWQALGAWVVPAQ